MHGFCMSRACRLCKLQPKYNLQWQVVMLNIRTNDHHYIKQECLLWQVKQLVDGILFSSDWWVDMLSGKHRYIQLLLLVRCGYCTRNHKCSVCAWDYMVTPCHCAGCFYTYTQGENKLFLRICWIANCNFACFNLVTIASIGQYILAFLFVILQ